MKVVLFCGGYGMRLREYSESTPKPMVNVGYRPIMWHIMKYYAHYGHTDFILCLGWKANVIKEYFLNYDECMSNDFVLSAGGKVRSLRVHLHPFKVKPDYLLEPLWKDVVAFAVADVHADPEETAKSFNAMIKDSPSTKLKLTFKLPDKR